MTMPATPELACRPALLLAVVFRARLRVALELFEHKAVIAARARRVVAHQQVANRVGCEYAGAQRFDDPLRGERVEPRGGVADGQPVVAHYRLKASRLGGVNDERAARLAPLQERADAGHGGELLTPLFRLAEAQAASHIRIGHAGSDASSVG